MIEGMKRLLFQAWAHAGDTWSILKGNLASSVLPEIIIGSTIIYLLSLVPGLPKLEGFTYIEFAGIGISVGVACFSAYRTVILLLDQMWERGILGEVLGAPVGTWLPVLVWLFSGAFAGTLAGTFMMLVPGRAAGLSPVFLGMVPIFLVSSFFSAIGVVSWVFLGETWRKWLTRYVLPFIIILSGIFFPFEQAGPFGQVLLLVDPVFHGACFLKETFKNSGNPFGALFSLGVLLPLTTGSWFFALDLSRRGIGLRTRDYSICEQLY